MLLHAEHITLLRRLLRLPPRSLLPSAGGLDAASFTLRLCGISAQEEGVALAREELVKPLVECYCDAELLFQERRPGKSPSASSVGVGESAQVIFCFQIFSMYESIGVFYYRRVGVGRCKNPHDKEDSHP